MAHTTYQKYGAELLGTFLLTFAIAMSLTNLVMVSTPIVAGLSLVALVYILGPISGAHLNPAVTVGLFSLKKIAFNDALFYIVAQLVGAFLAGLLLMGMGHAPSLPVTDAAPAMIAELIGTFMIAFGVITAAHGKVPEAAAGWAIGLSLFIGIIVAKSGSLAVINPAIALGFGAYSFTYLLVPLVGGFLASQVYRVLWGKGK